MWKKHSLLCYIAIQHRIYQTRLTLCLYENLGKGNRIHFKKQPLLVVVVTKARLYKAGK